MTTRVPRQEQEAAGDAVDELAPGVRRVQLPISLPGLGHVNCYLLDDERGVALVDPGLPGPSAYRALKAALRRAGLRLRDVHTVVVTHSHPDHFGAAGRIRAETGAEVITHASFRLWWDAAEEQFDEVEHVLGADDNADALDRHAHAQAHAGRPVGPDGPVPWGGPSGRVIPLRRRLFFAAMRRGFGGRFFAAPSPSRRVLDGAVLPLAGRELVALHTPGHTVDHLCLWDPGTGLLLSGDHVLPSITPHISGLTAADDPLAEFFESLERVAELPDASLVLPAHGHPFTDLEGRAAAIRRHHEERLDVLRTTAGELPAGTGTVPDYMRRLFKERVWGPMAESETYAHLEHLRHTGEARRHRRADGVLEYTLAH
jgi:glyoxylase-like metal-dependent hydrolase (beta-lactamase superfamily II)